MTAHLYTLRHYASAAVHYTATAGLLATTALVAPAWVIGAAAVLIGGISYASIKTQRKIFEENLMRHPDVSDVSPTLGKIAQDLYKASGLKADDYPIYDFRIDESKVADKSEEVRKKLSESFNTMAAAHNAAAMNFGKPVIMISKPLLALLDEAEEKAVLAHEFAHAKARHNHLGLPQRLAAGVIGASNGITRLGAFLSAGWVGVPVAIVSGLVAAGMAMKHGKQPDGQAPLPDEYAATPAARLVKKQMQQRAARVGGFVTLAVVTAFNPVYPVVYAITKTIGAAAKFVTSAFSRSNEYQADRGAVELGASPLALISALRKMKAVQEVSLKETFGDALPKAGKLKTAWKNANATHPTIPRRVARLADIAKKKGYDAAQIDAAVNSNIAIGPEHRMAPALIEKMLAR